MLKIVKVNGWTPTANPWVCRGPEFFTPPGKEHVATEGQTIFVVLEDTGYSWRLCEDCAAKLGKVW